uniref:SAGA-associated factor 11 n=1 Tax=Spongospora subterranea TaxID=70186 RepID=A0A0H5R9Z2_9EUKA|eukprot:CRZ10955.1 hypothetical protein [Spongospora subterranea]
MNGPTPDIDIPELVKQKDIEIAQLQQHLATANSLCSLLKIIDFNTIVEDMLESLVDEMSVDLCFNVHQSVKANGKIELDPANDDHNDIFGQQGAKLAGSPFQCRNCQRMISSSKYAFHTRRCPGRR